MTIIGIDEAGRGPFAGPLVIAAVSGLKPRHLKGIRDSKKLVARERERWFRHLNEYGTCRYISISPQVLDRRGLTRPIKAAIARLLFRFPFPPDRILLDGSLYAPKRYEQKTIIKGDEKIALISAASIIAKVVRDRKMIRYHKMYPNYNFHIHKGYGTKKHRELISTHGLSPIHRRSFCKYSLSRGKTRTVSSK